MTTSRPRAEQIQRRSRLLTAFYCVQEFFDDFCWSKTISSFINDNSFGLLCYGPNGCGKHTLVGHAIQALQNKGEPYNYIFLSEADLTSDSSEYAQLSDFLIKQRDQSIMDCTSLCLVLDRLDLCNFQRELLCQLEEMLLECWQSEEKTYNLFFIMLAEREVALPTAIRVGINICALGLPTLNQRSSFIDRVLAERALDDSVSSQRVAGFSAGLSYNQLDALLLSLCNLIYQRNVQDVSDDELKELINSHRCLYGNRIKSDLYEKLYDLVVAAPSLLQNLPTMTAQNSASQQIIPLTTVPDIYKDETPEAYSERMRDIIANASPIDNLKAVFGEKAQEIRNSLSID